MIVIYLITNLLNGKTYIGQTNNFKRRWKEHRRCIGSAHLAKAMRKYGRGNFDMQPLATLSTQTDADSMERLWIVCLRSYDKHHGYNLQRGGQLHAGHSAETRELIKTSMKAKGLSPSPAVRLLANQANTGMKRSAETRAKMSARKIGKPWTEAQRKSRMAQATQ